MERGSTNLSFNEHLFRIVSPSRGQAIPAVDENTTIVVMRGSPGAFILYRVLETPQDQINAAELAAGNYICYVVDRRVRKITVRGGQLTRDLRIEAEITYRVADPVQAVLGENDPLGFLRSAVASLIRHEAPHLPPGRSAASLLEASILMESQELQARVGMVVLHASVLVQRAGETLEEEEESRGGQKAEPPEREEMAFPEEIPMAEPEYATEDGEVGFPESGSTGGFPINVPEPSDSSAESPAKTQGMVSTGFVPCQNPNQPVTDRSPLVAGQRYYFLYSIGARLAFDIAPLDAPIRLPLDLLPSEALLQVVLFSFPGEIEIAPALQVGELRLRSDGTASVERRVVCPRGLSEPSLLDEILFFPVRMPKAPGRYRLRVNLYCQGVLVQSILVHAEVVSPSRDVRSPSGQPAPALLAELDYTLSNQLKPQVLAALEPHSLSLMINDNGDGTHGFRLFGSTGDELFKEDATFSGQELQNLIDQARAALRQASWGEKTEWNPAWDVTARYKYINPRAGAWKERLRADLVLLAKAGWRIYTAVERKIAEQGASTPDEADAKRARIKAALLQTGRIQVACKENLRHILPAALIYDHPIHDALPSNLYTLCSEFLAALDAGTPLEQTACFQGDCPSQGNLQVVCPSGFWGFRHILGLPVSIGAGSSDADTLISYRGAPELTVAYAADFSLRAAHLQKLHHLRTLAGWNEAQTGMEALQYMRTKPAHLVYFYCHGGLTDDQYPYIQVGPQNDAFGLITPALLPAMDIHWRDPHPLIFINGCHTTALQPEAALDLVTGFVRDARAAGVIGTEITIFESLATAFAEECLAYFLNEVPIGEAIRRARLKLLQGGNPLGLVYIPFVVASLALHALDGN